MKKKNVFPVISLLIVSLLLPTQVMAKNEEEQRIKQIITEVAAFYDKLNIEAAQKHYHEGFELLMCYENKLNKYPIYSTLEDLKRRQLANNEGEKRKIDIDFKYIDIAGNAAIVKFLFLVNGKLSCTDYMSLYKFNEGWRIVSQTTYHHGE